MFFYLYILFACTTEMYSQPEYKQERIEIKIVNDLFRLRNEHKADSAEQYFSDTVKVYMKYFRNVSKRKITKSDKSFWKAHPKYKFEMTAPVQIAIVNGITTATILGKEYLDGKDFIYERIEIRFDKNKKINYFRGYVLKKAS